MRRGNFDRSRHTWLPGVFLLLVALLISGCATQTRNLLHAAPENLPRRAELKDTPFFPQERYQCGPAALATVLQVAGRQVTPEALVSQVYVPERQGSLPPEMLAAGRRNGALSMPLAPRLDVLLHEVAAGTPVVVLQNLSLSAFPLWHYAVVIGYDLDAGDIVLRSGTVRRQVMRLSTFERTWARSKYWAMVALPPGRMPLNASEPSVVPAVVALEKSVNPEQAMAAYRAALKRWPDNPVLQFGFGNSAYAAGDLPAAAAAFRAAAKGHSDSAPAFNNLATVLAEMGDLDGAREAAQRAVALGGPWTETSQATLARVQQMSNRPRQDSAEANQDQAMLPDAEASRAP